MATSKLISSIVNSNNHGASMIEQGECKVALTHLTVALKSAKACIAQDNGERGSYDCQAGIIFSLDALFSSNALRDASSDDVSLIFDRPIHIPVSLSSKQHPASVHHPSPVLCSVISLFNLALAHHLQALDRPAQSFMTLKKASKLYECAMQLMQGSMKGMFGLVLLNNLSDVYQRLGDLVRAEQSCEDLLRIVVQVSESQQISAKLLEVLYQDSFFSLLSFRSVHVASAA